MLLLLLLETLIQEGCNDWQKMLIQGKKTISISQVSLWGAVNFTSNILEKYILKTYRDAHWIYWNRWRPMTSLYVCGVEFSGPMMEVSILPKPHLPSGIALSCIGDGFLNPLLWRPFKVTSDNSIPVKSISSLINTSCVRGLSSNTWAVWRGIFVQQNIKEIICEVTTYNTQAKELQKSKHPGDIPQLSLRIQPLKHNTPKPPIMPLFSIN